MFFVNIQTFRFLINQYACLYFFRFFSYTTYSPFSCNKKFHPTPLSILLQKAAGIFHLFFGAYVCTILFGTFSGVAKDKIVVGMPTYGRSFTVPSWSDMKPPISPASAGSKGPITGEAGFLGYLEICLGIKNGGWTGVMTFLRKIKKSYF